MKSMITAGEVNFLYCSCDAVVPIQALTCQGGRRGWEEKIFFMGGGRGSLFNDRSGFWFSRVWLAPDLALYSLPIILLRFRDLLSLQLLEHSSARRQGAVDITQKRLRVGVTVSDKAVIQLLQLIRKSIWVTQRRHVSFRHTMESCFQRRLMVCVYCNGWGMLTGCSC